MMKTPSEPTDDANVLGNSVEAQAPSIADARDANVNQIGAAERRETRGVGWRPRIVVVALMLGFIALTVRLLYLTTDAGLKLRAAVFVANSPQSALNQLVKETADLSRLADNFEEMSIADIRRRLRSSIAVADRAALEFEAQSKAWSYVRGKIKDDSSTYDALRRDLAESQRLQEDEVRRLKRLLDDAQKPSLIADTWNLSLSFFLGVLSSLLATAMYEKWKERLRRDSGKKRDEPA